MTAPDHHDQQARGVEKIAGHMRSGYYVTLAVADQLDAIAAALRMGGERCCVCGATVDTRENGTPGAELTDGRWTCGPECWERATEAKPEAVAEAFGIPVVVNEAVPPGVAVLVQDGKPVAQIRTAAVVDEAMVERARWLLDCAEWKVHPDSMSHDEAGSLYVWAQDAAGLLAKVAALSQPASGESQP